MVAKDLRQALLDGTATLLMPKRGCSAVQRFYNALRGRCWSSFLTWPTKGIPNIRSRIWELDKDWAKILDVRKKKMIILQKWICGSKSSYFQSYVTSQIWHSSRSGQVWFGIVWSDAALNSTGISLHHAQINWNNGAFKFWFETGIFFLFLFFSRNNLNHWKLNRRAHVTLQNTKGNTKNIKETGKLIIGCPLGKRMGLLIESPRHPV